MIVDVEIEMDCWDIVVPKSCVKYTLKRLSMPTLAVNKQARFEYEILDQLEAGLELLGPEVKVVRAGGMKLRGTFVKVVAGGLVLLNSFIPKYEKATVGMATYDPYRTRRLLVNKKELKRISDALDTRGVSAIALEVYTRGRYLKIKIATARGRKTHEKREVLKKRDVDREIKRELKR